MPMLTDEDLDAVIGVDTHADTHTAAICDARGGVLTHLQVSADEDGYAELLQAVLDHAPGPRVRWAVEGTGSYGAGLARALEGWGQDVAEVRAAPRARGAAKNDTADAVALARTLLTGEHHAQPRTGTTREVLAIITRKRAADVRARTRLTNQLKAQLLGAPDALREKLRHLATDAQIAAAARLRTPAGADALTATVITALRDIARQIRALDTVIAQADKRLDTLTRTHAAPIRAELGAGPVSTAQLLITYSHRGRFHCEAAFAAVAGTSPLEASSGKTVRHRLNRTGDRQLNAAIHRIMHTRRTQKDPATCAYIDRRRAEGKSDKEIERALKRYLTRHLYRLLQALPPMP